jgi:hypothetical protein
MVVATAAASYSSRAAAETQAQGAGTAGVSTTSLDPDAALVSASYEAELTDGTQDPGSPHAVLRLDYDASTRSVLYCLEMTSALPNPSVAAICQGRPGQSGMTVFTVFAGPTISGRFSGILAQGEIAAADLVGPLRGHRVTDLILLVKEGGAYATVGTAAVPIDAIRGQIESSPYLR